MTAPRHARRTTKPKRRLETSLRQNICIAVGSRNDFSLVRTNAGTFRAMHSDAIIRGLPKGFPDLMGWQRRDITRYIRFENQTSFHRLEKNVPFVFGQIVFIETKVGRNGLTQQQADFRDWATKLGAVYIEARSVDDVLNELDGWDAVR